VIFFPESTKDRPRAVLPAQQRKLANELLGVSPVPSRYTGTKTSLIFPFEFSNFRVAGPIWRRVVGKDEGSAFFRRVRACAHLAG
jgi:hypothetical protein